VGLGYALISIECRGARSRFFGRTIPTGSYRSAPESPSRIRVRSLVLALELFHLTRTRIMPVAPPRSGISWIPRAFAQGQRFRPHTGQVSNMVDLLQPFVGQTQRARGQRLQRHSGWRWRFFSSRRASCTSFGRTSTCRLCRRAYRVTLLAAILAHPPKPGHSREPDRLRAEGRYVVPIDHPGLARPDRQRSLKSPQTGECSSSRDKALRIRLPIWTLQRSAR